MTRTEDPKNPSKSTENKVVDLAPRIKRKNKRTLKNAYSFEDEKGKEVFIGFDAREIAESLKEIVGDWPRRIGNRLFIPPNGEIYWLDTANKVMGWLSGDQVALNWKDKAIEGVSKSEFISALQLIATPHTGFAKLPHFPPKPGYYYVQHDLPESEGAFEKLLSFFNPVDPDLLKAAFMTLFWGGPSGARPAFVFTGLEDDSGGGRGVGKTTLTDVMAALAGGAIDFSPKMNDIEAAKKRLLTSNGERIIRFDNVKSSRMSNGDIEGLITLPQISGHVMFHGNGTLPNDFTFLFTFNDVSFSKDMAQRAVPIQLKRPQYSGNWTKDVFDFLNENRLKIIAGIRDAFAKDPIESTDYLRFGQWTKEVLNRATTRTDVVEVIKAFQESVDDDNDRTKDVESAITDQLSRYKVVGYGASKGLTGALEVRGEAFLIRSGLVNQWVNDALRLGMSNVAVSRFISRCRSKHSLGTREIGGHTYMIWSHEILESHPQGGWRIDSDAKVTPTVDRFSEFRK